MNHFIVHVLDTLIFNICFISVAVLRLAVVFFYKNVSPYRVVPLDMHKTRSQLKVDGIMLTVYPGTARGRQMDLREIKLECNTAQERSTGANDSNGSETERDAIKWSL
jgi:hypothetical protein